MPNVNNLNFPEYMFAPEFLHTLGDNFVKQNQHGMKELSGIPRELMHCFGKRVYLHFALVSMETENLG